MSKAGHRHPFFASRDEGHGDADGNMHAVPGGNAAMRGARRGMSQD